MNKRIGYTFPAAIMALMLSFAGCAGSAGTVAPDFMADADPAEIGMYTVGLQNAFSPEIETQEGRVTLYPRTGAVSIDFSVQWNTYRLTLDKKARAHFIQALETYRSCMEQKTLNTKWKRPRPLDGKVPASLAWGLFENSVFSLSSESRPVIFCSYLFAGSSPYFILQIPAAPVTDAAPSAGRDSLSVTLFFTLEEAAALADMFDEQTLCTRAQSAAPDTVPQRKPDTYGQQPAAVSAE